MILGVVHPTFFHPSATSVSPYCECTYDSSVKARESFSIFSVFYVVLQKSSPLLTYVWVTLEYSLHLWKMEKEV